MLGLFSARSSTVLTLSVFMCAVIPASGDVLLSLGTTDVATTYTYPDGGDPGVLALSDTGLGVIATFDDLSQTTINDVQLTLSVELIAELGDPGDEFAHGGFGGGTLTMATGLGGGTVIFEAQLTDFELVEVIPGAYTGSGSFINAIYGGDLANVTLPTEGDLLTSLFSWHIGDAGGPVVDIDNFITPPVGETAIFADMENLNVVPEPTTLALLTMLICAIRRTRR